MVISATYDVPDGDARARLSGVTDPLSDLRSKPGLPARLGSLLFSGVRQVEATRRPVADWWEAHNREAVAADGPLWVVFGDSTSQGIGSSDPGSGYVLDVRDRLRSESGEPWRVVNLSITGAKMADVVDKQVPAFAALDLEAALVTSFVGANDLLYPWGVDRAVADAERLVEALPTGALQSKLGGGPPSKPKARAVNQVLRSAAEQGSLRLFNAWDWLPVEGVWAPDRFHPNDKGYSHLTESIWRAVETAVA